jgi:hypothetical protein
MVFIFSEITGVGLQIKYNHAALSGLPDCESAQIAACFPLNRRMAMFEVTHLRYRV